MGVGLFVSAILLAILAVALVPLAVMYLVVTSVRPLW